MLWHGLSVAIGRGDPTWNDGEGVWLTGFGLLYTALVGFGISQGVRFFSLRGGPGSRLVTAVLWIVPTVALHVLFAASVLGPGD
ncbi:hypothetical protein FNH13_03505 [Ornithinimicrobium ciconiae]|uniref:Uncharacterized protein n=1 Tax=Ornithinimicrobium ciconiae TaxID=2594265 RepID=A0A516G7K9_9MICO|nr:hypothetical protein [Ornithinimicrobium ciconiae]QDO87517.1 hypothetical protein FNH13_03505 [Ornithinimicrobium ciconiae]